MKSYIFYVSHLFECLKYIDMKMYSRNLPQPGIPAISLHDAWSFKQPWTLCSAPIISIRLWVVLHLRTISCTMTGMFSDPTRCFMHYKTCKSYSITSLLASRGHMGSSGGSTYPMLNCLASDWPRKAWGLIPGLSMEGCILKLVIHIYRYTIPTTLANCNWLTDERRGCAWKVRLMLTA